MAERVDALLLKMHPADGEELFQALQIIENPVLGAVLDFRFQPFSVASPALQKHTFYKNWKTSRLAVRRTGYVALTGLDQKRLFLPP